MFAWMKEILDKLLAVVLSLLPLSPFKEFIDKLEDIPFLGYLNYFIPVGTCLKIGVQRCGTLDKIDRVRWYL